MPEPVRPTFRVLEELGAAVPTLDVPISDAAHPLITKAQSIPEELSAGGAEPILSLKDRQWWKVKITDFRGAVVHAGTPGELRQDESLPSRAWWPAAAGHRKDDSATQDFYARLETESKRAGRGTGKVSTDHLLPTTKDYRRWQVELATRWVVELQQVVRHTIAMAAHWGKPHVAETDGYIFRAQVSVDSDGVGETYLAVSIEGFLNPRQIAVILDAIPGVHSDEWIAEPGDKLGITPGPGQLVYSTLLEAKALAALLDEADGDSL